MTNLPPHVSLAPIAVPVNCVATRVTPVQLAIFVLDRFGLVVPRCQLVGLAPAQLWQALVANRCEWCAKPQPYPRQSPLPSLSPSSLARLPLPHGLRSAAHIMQAHNMHSTRPFPPRPQFPLPGELHNGMPNSPQHAGANRCSDGMISWLPYPSLNPLTSLSSSSLRTGSPYRRGRGELEAHGKHDHEKRSYGKGTRHFKARPAVCP